jgi:hypothetical protein
MPNTPKLLFARNRPVSWKCDACEELFELSSDKRTLQERLWDLESRFENHLQQKHSLEKPPVCEDRRFLSRLMRGIARQTSPDGRA